jgi:flagellar biosynthetic protein FliR
MDWINSLEILHGYAIFLRAGAFLFLMPFLASPVPMVVRTAISLFFAVILVPLMEPSELLILPTHPVGLLIITIRELFIGLLMGFSVQLVFHLCHFSGQLISMEIGLMQSNLFNPLTKQQDTVLSTGLTMLVITLIFSMNVHHLLLYAFVRSLELMPAGSMIQGVGTPDVIVRATGNIFILGLQMAAPLIAVNYIITLSFAILGRAVPGMNILVLSFGVRVFVGLSVLALVFGMIVQFLIGMINDSPEQMLQFLPFR